MNAPWWAWLLLIPATMIGAVLALLWWVLDGIRLIMTGALELDDESGTDDD